VRKVLLAALIVLRALPAGALSFGLGAGAARAAKKTVEKAAAAKGCSLTSVGTTVFTTSPISPAYIKYIEPLGHFSPPGHTLPTGHIYFYYVDPSDPDPSKFNVNYNIYAAADGYITGIYYYQEGASLQYKLSFAHTATFSSYYDHVGSLDASIAALAGPLPFGWNNVCIPVTAGQLLGTTGGWHQMAVDFGVLNLSVTQPFIDGSHYGGSANADAPLKYYQAPLQTTLYGLVTRQTPDYAGSNSKDGVMCYDVANTVQGGWIAQGAPSDWMGPAAWDQQLTIAYGNVYSSAIHIVFGGKHGAQAFGAFGEWMVHAGAQAPANITVASGAYGYQLWHWDPNNGNRSGAASFGLFMVQLLDNRTLKAQYFPGSTNAFEPFDGNAKIFTR
jgi:hypothetical protein